MTLRSHLAAAVILAAALSGCGTTVPHSQQLAGTPDLNGVTLTPTASSAPEAVAAPAGVDPLTSTGGVSGLSPDAPGSSTDTSVSTGEASAQPEPATAGAAQASGTGFTSNVAYVGVAIQSDASAVGGAIGYSSLDFGNQKKIIGAAIQGINARGGILGRKLSPIFFDYQTTGNNETQVAAACALWTQDHQVIFTSLVPDISTEQMFQCLHKAHVPIVSPMTQPFLAKDLARYAPDLNVSNAASIDRLVEPWLDQLQKLEYFTPWDSAAGKPGKAPVKVAIIHQDVPFYDRSWALVEQRLKQRNIVVADVLAYGGGDASVFSNYALKMRADGVTHLFLDNLASVFYPAQAESQGFRARYAVSSFNYLQPFLVGGAPKAQLAGMTGIGWLPHLDVKDAQDPGAFGLQAQCLSDMRRFGADISKRNYRYIAFTACDEYGLAQKAAALGGGLTRSALINGVHAAAPKYRWNAQFVGGFTNGDPTLLGGVRGIRYDPTCGCTRYVGATIPV